MTSRTAGWKRMRDFLKDVAVGPKGSRSLNTDEAFEAMALCLSREASDIQIGTFLIAERLKRETQDENTGFLRALVEASHVKTVSSSHVVSLADPYDGFNRVPHFSPVVAAVLGACGLPSYVHGVREMPPKSGITARQVFAAFGIPLDVGRKEASVADAAQRVEESGAAYVDMEDFCPALHDLSVIREEIAKRPFLATLEKLITPIRGNEQTTVCAGWVHRGYDETVVETLAGIGIDSVFMVKGREGHVDPSVSVDTGCYVKEPGTAAQTVSLQPKSYGLLVSKSESWDSLSADKIAELWDQALTRKHRTLPAQTVRLLAGTLLAHCGKASTIMRGVGMAHGVIVDGSARRVLMAMGGG
jgi:anthranilate phosphoribosyltransferase